MIKHKKVTVNQHYEDYWKLTLEYTDIYNKQFNKVLELCVKYIDLTHGKGWTSAQYKSLQKEINDCFNKVDQASTRKSINQMFKLGFLNNGAKSYHVLTKQFLEEKDMLKKKSLFSKIIYDNASFERSFTKIATINELKFLIKTLEHNKELTKLNLFAVMFTNINDHKNGYLTPKELAEKTEWVVKNNINERKYNQVAYLWKVCSCLSGIYVGHGKKGKNVISLDPEAIISRREMRRDGYGRDPYLQRLFKLDLINEYKKLYSSEIIMCVLEKKRFPKLIASHIKPYRYCSKTEQFDSNNGLLLSPKMDHYFDKGYITFDDTGNIVFSKHKKITVEDQEYMKTLKLDDVIYNKIRQKYMIFHRENMLK